MCVCMCVHMYACAYVCAHVCKLEKFVIGSFLSLYLWCPVPLLSEPSCGLSLFNLIFTFTFVFFETGSRSCSLDGCETCNADEACFEPTSLLLTLPPACSQAQSGSGTFTRSPNRKAAEIGIWRQGGSGIWAPHFWPVCLCECVEFAVECHLQERGMLSRLFQSHLWLGSSLESAFIHLALEVRGTLCCVILSIFQRRKVPLGCYQQTAAQLHELPMWLTTAPSFSLGASVEKANEGWASSPPRWSRAMLWQDCILSRVGDLFFGEYKTSN